MAAAGDSPACCGLVKELVERARPCVLRPRCFFVAWNGVLTIAYSGFPPSLARLKSELSAEIDALPPEKPGSLWPKTTLAAVKDNRRLSPKQLTALGKICREATEAMSRCSQGNIQVVVDRLSVVFYACRCLERTLFKANCKLAGMLDDSEPTQESKEFTRQVVDEVNTPDYWFHASKDGHRESHYRGNAMGLTLVHELGHFSSPTQQYWHQLPGKGASCLWGAAVQLWHKPDAASRHVACGINPTQLRAMWPVA
ncbi:unnamed protein product [Ostreobium quekettii]|uniref:Uncharacterized protein n=1 Tax=Ostreobium quekettii TaxID=121088 RepID=A0A8S1J6B6_9CHLO|nr:unnamed protein product [Ostreobium quekettii]